jgi:DNA-binding transcriptional MerR regulator
MRISQLADRSGVPTSTLRYYERIGLIEPLARADNGYRVYDEAAVERLAFVGRAKRLGMRLDDVATLVEAWFAGECGPIQDRLREFVTGRLAEIRAQMVEDVAFERQLERILAGLEEGVDVPKRCRPDCGCDTDPLDGTVAEGAPGAGGCSLGERELQRRLLDWRRVLAGAVHTTTADGEVRVVFDSAAGVVVELARLCAAEMACCPFLSFNLDITSAAVVLTVAGDEGLIGPLGETNVAVSSPMACAADRVGPRGRGEAGAR